MRTLEAKRVSTDELASHWQVGRVFNPTLARSRASELMQGWEHAVAQATLMATHA